jgi:hypothetical protein
MIKLRVRKFDICKLYDVSSVALVLGNHEQSTLLVTTLRQVLSQSLCTADPVVDNEKEEDGEQQNVLEKKGCSDLITDWHVFCANNSLVFRQWQRHLQPISTANKEEKEKEETNTASSELPESLELLGNNRRIKTTLYSSVSSPKLSEIVSEHYATATVSQTQTEPFLQSSFVILDAAQLGDREAASLWQSDCVRRWVLNGRHLRLPGVIVRPYCLPPSLRPNIGHVFLPWGLSLATQKQYFRDYFQDLFEGKFVQFQLLYQLVCQKEGLWLVYDQNDLDTPFYYLGVPFTKGLKSENE